MSARLGNVLATICLITAVISAGLFALVLRASPEHEINEPRNLSDFMVGRWVGEFHELETGLAGPSYYQLEFMPPNTLIYNRLDPSHQNYNVVMQYEVVEPDRVIVRSRAPDEWEIIRDKQGLIILASQGLVQAGLYEAKPTFEWRFLSITLGMLILFVLFLQPRSSHDTGNLQRLERQVGNTFRSRTLMFVSQLLIFCVGVVAAILVLQSHPLRLVRIPWDIVITIEAGVVLLLSGAKGLIYVRSGYLRKHSLWAALAHWAGVLMVGMSGGSLLIGLSKLAVVLALGSYPIG